MNSFSQILDFLYRTKQFILCFILFFTQTLPNYCQVTCDSTYGYRFGANFNSQIPFSPPIINNYNLLYSDITREGDDYSISSSIKLPVSRPIINKSFFKLHINDHLSHTYRDVKFDRYDYDRVLSHTPRGGGQYFMSGKTEPSIVLTPSRFVSEGFIKLTDKDGFSNIDILTNSTIRLPSNIPIQGNDVILKTIEDNNYIYACGYKIMDLANRKRIGILYIIDKALINNQGHYQCNHDGGILAPVRLYTIGTSLKGVISDILLDGNELIYCGSHEALNLTVGYIGKLDLSTMNFVEKQIVTRPFFPPPTNNIPLYVNCLTKGNLPGEYYALYRRSAIKSTTGIVKFDKNLDSIYSYMFDIDLGINGGPFGSPLWTDAFLTNMEIDAQDNIFIGGFVKDYNCLPANRNCEYRHISFQFNEPAIKANLGQIFGYIDFEYVNLDNDPFQKTGGAVNSLSTINKIPRTIVLDPTLDTLHIAYPYSEIIGGKSSITHYTRPKIDYINRRLDNCTKCTRDMFYSDVIVPLVDYKHYRTDEMEMINDCDINIVQGNESKWYEEYPVMCDQSIIDSDYRCKYWNGINTTSGSDTLCKNTPETLYVSLKTPYGQNTYEWVETSNTSVVLSTNNSLIVTSAGTYQVTCTRNQSDGSLCTETFTKIISAPLNADITTLRSTICQGETIELEAKPISYITPNTYKYLWSNGTTYVANDITQSGKYSVTITFDNGCVDNANIEIGQGNASLAINPSMKTSGHATNENFVAIYDICNESSEVYTSKNLTVTVPSGYTIPSPVPTGWTLLSSNPLKLDYTFSLGAGTISSPNCTTISLPLIAINPCKAELIASHNAFVTGSTCTGPTLNTILNPSRDLVPSIDPSTTSNLCKQTPITLTAYAGGLPSTNIIFNWSGISPTALPNLATSQDYTYTNNNASLNQEIYKVNIMVDNACSGEVTKTVNYFSEPLLQLSLDKNDFCKTDYGYSTCKLFVSDPSLNGGKAPYKYIVNNNLRPINLNNGKYQVDISIANNYVVKLEDANGCSIVKTIDILKVEPATLNIYTSNPSSCNTNGLINISFTPGQNQKPNYTYTISDWHKNTILSTTISNSLYNVNVKSGKYDITVTDRDQCVMTAQATIQDPTKPQVSFIQTEICNSGLVSIDPQISPANNSYSYEWRLNGGLNNLATTKNINYTAGQSLIFTLKSYNPSCINTYDLTSVAANSLTYNNNGVIPLGTYTDKSITIIGKVSLNANVLLNNCKIYMIKDGTTPGHLNISSAGKLTLNNSTLDVCNTDMAQGIVVQNGGSLHLQNTTIRNMFKGVEFLGSSSNFVCKGNIFEKCMIGLYLNSSSGSVTMSAGESFGGNQFIGDITGSGLLSPSTMIYETGSILMPTTQNYSFSLAGILSKSSSLTNFTIGNSTVGSSQNLFKNLQIGVGAVAGNLTVHNSSFENIKSIPALNFAPGGNAIYAQSAQTKFTLNVGLYQANQARNTVFANVDKAILSNGYQLKADYLDISNSKKGIEFKRGNIGVSSIEILNNYIIAIEQCLSIYDDLADATNWMKMDINSNSFTTPVITSGFKTYPAIDIKGDFPSTSYSPWQGIPPAPYSQISNNMLSNGANDIGIMLTNIHNLISENNQYTIGSTDLSQSCQTALCHFKGCNQITDQTNQYSGNSISQMGGGSFYKPMSSQYNSFYPVMQVLEDVKNSLFKCNTYKLNSVSSILVKASECNGNANTFIKNNNFMSKGFGIIIENNTNNIPNPIGCLTLPMHINSGNKFYCGSNSVATISSLSTAITGGFLSQFTTGNAPVVYSNSCPIVPYNSAYPHAFFVQGSIAAMSVNNVMKYSANAGSETLICPEIRQMPKMAVNPSLGQTIEKNDCNLFPNPTYAISKIKLDIATKSLSEISIYDLTGKIVLKDQIQAGISEYKVVGDQLSKGIYQIIIREGDKVLCNQKLVIEK